jgi:hypothetical protein
VGGLLVIFDKLVIDSPIIEYKTYKITCVTIPMITKKILDAFIFLELNPFPAYLNNIIIFTE